MPKMSDLGLSNERVGQQDLDYTTMPDQMGGFADPPQPGPYRFKLPSKLDDIWETFDHTTSKNPGKRITAIFDSTHPLQIVQSVGDVYNGTPFETRISNAERKRGKRDDATAPEISDMDYLFRDSFSVAGKPATNVAYAQELIKHAGEEFTADIEFSWRCPSDRAIRVDNGQGGLSEVTGQNGCGSKYYQQSVDKVDGKYPIRIQCTCGASIRAFANLTRYR